MRLLSSGGIGWFGLAVGLAVLLTAFPASAQYGLQFDGSNDYVTFGAASGLGVTTFTLELWFYKAGAGVTTSTGTGGVTAVPLITKGRGEADGSNKDMNFFLGIDASNRLCADYEEGTGQTSPGLNHPVTGSTTIQNYVWNHAAATFDGTKWQLFLNGNLEAELTVGASRLPQNLSIQHAALATALTSTGTAAGYFNGFLDEGRIWNYARPQQSIADSMNVELASGTGLVARWGMGEGTGTTIASSVGTFPGTLTNGPVWIAGYNWSPYSLSLGSSSAYVTFGDPAALDLAQFTLECWFRRDGPGVGVGTGSGGVTAIPLVTKGGAESDGSAVDMNYFMGIRSADSVLCADFEEGSGGSTPGLNHPIAGVTPIETGTWYHAAATYDGTTWKLYLNGELENQLSVGQPVQSASTQHAGLGASLNSSGTPIGSPAGAFNGTIDEARIWNSARSDGDIMLTINSRIKTPTTGLVARWGLDEGVLSKVYGTAGTGVTGTITGSGYTWSSPAPFDITPPPPPAAPSDLAATGVSESQIDLSWADNSNNEARFEIERSTTGSGGPFAWLANVNAGVNTYSNTGLAPATEYCYRVRAANAGGTSDYSNVACDSTLAEQPPAAPSGLAATAVSLTQINLAWTDNSSNELAFEIERANYEGGPYTPVDTLAANTQAFSDVGLTGGTDYCYRVRATNAAGASDYCTPACVTTLTSGECAFDFGSGNGYVTFGNATALGLSEFTLECWLRRDGTGTTANTGTGGVLAIPLVTKGVGEADDDNRDMNYFLGIRGTDGVLAADFEEGAGGTDPGLNHPVVGVTPIANGTWYHAAVTYDGTGWALYLNGMLENTLTVGQPCQSASIQHAGLGVALTSTGTASGHFDGALDEVRIWNYARTQTEIQATINDQIATTETGLVARWGMDECTGTTLQSTAGTVINGTVTNTGWSWTYNAPFDIVINNPPDQPTLNAPADDATGVVLSPALDVNVTDSEGDSLTVTFYGRAVNTAVGEPFSIVHIPDTQYYTSETNGGTIAMFQAQTQFCVDSVDVWNIVYVNHVGDISENGDTYLTQWEKAWSAMSTLEDSISPAMPQGIPYDMTLGNHDQTPSGDATGTTTYFNQFFGVSHFTDKAYYGGHHGTNNDNHFTLFSASGLDFIVISMEYDSSPDAPVLAWADSLLGAYSSRWGIVSVHNTLGTGNPASFSAQGSAVYEALKANPNFFLFLCGHAPGEGRRSDTYNGRTVHSLLADYQSRTNGGSGWLRIITLDPANGYMYVKTYSPTLNQYEADADSSSQFTLPIDLVPMEAWQMIGSVKVASGDDATVQWPGREALTEYEWYVTVDDGNELTTGPVWSFTTRSLPPSVAVVAPNGGESLEVGETAAIQWTASDDIGVTAIDLLVSRDGAEGTYEPMATGIANSGTFEWTVTGPITDTAFIKAVAYDGDGSSASDVSDASFSVVDMSGVPGDGVLELAFRMESPNPMRGTGHFSFAIPSGSRVKIAVYDVRGSLVATLTDQVYEPGRYQATWDGTAAGRALTGVHFVMFQACGSQIKQKIVLVN